MATSPSSALQAHVLALNRLYVAVQIITARRALCLLWKGLADVVSAEHGAYMTYDFQSWREISELKVALNERGQDEDWVQAVNFEIEVPRTIRLLEYDRVPRNVIKFNRRNIFLRDRNRCQYCGKRFASQDLSLDHVIPRSRGGQSTWENIVCACLRCNVRKGGRTPREAGMRLIRPPKKPSRNPLLTVKLNSRKYASWKNFLDEAYWTTELQE